MVTLSLPGWSKFAQIQDEAVRDILCILTEPLLFHLMYRCVALLEWPTGALTPCLETSATAAPLHKCDADAYLPKVGKSLPRTIAALPISQVRRVQRLATRQCYGTVVTHACHYCTPELLEFITTCGGCPQIRNAALGMAITQ